MKTLLSILYDKNATEAEKDDAIIDLSDYDDIAIEESLLSAAKELNLSDMLLSSIGEALANIWIRKGHIDFNKLKVLPYLAQHEAICCIKNTAPELLNGMR